MQELINKKVLKHFFKLSNQNQNPCHVIKNKTIIIYPHQAAMAITFLIFMLVLLVIRFYCEGIRQQKITCRELTEFKCSKA